MERDCIEKAASRREQRKLDRRNAIIAAARQSFLENGYAATSMSGLLKSLGGSKATLWSFFRTKEELFAAVIDDATMAFHNLLDHELSPTGDLETTLVGFCRKFMQALSTPESLAIWRLVVAESKRFPEVRHVFNARAARHMQDALRHFLIAHIQAGHLRDEDPAMMAYILTTLCTGLQMQLLLGNATGHMDAMEADARAFTRYFLRSFAVA